MEVTYNKVTRIVWIKGKEKTYNLRLTINGLQELEAKAFDGLSYFDFQQAHKSLPMGTILTAFGIMLRDGKDKEAKNPAKVVEDIALQEGPQGLEMAFYTTLAVSGILGPKASSKILKEMGVKSEDPEPEEEPKNE